VGIGCCVLRTRSLPEIILHKLRGANERPANGKLVSACDKTGRRQNEVRRKRRLLGSCRLFTRTANAIGWQSWMPRAVSELNREITALSELPIDLTCKMNGLNAVARALNAGNIALAQVAMLNLRLPNLPDRQKAAASASLLEIARGLWESGILKSAEFDPAKHPRWPQGAPASQGGRFRAANDNDQAGAKGRMRATALSLLPV
jgi:hypothetical protein